MEIFTLIDVVILKSQTEGLVIVMMRVKILGSIVKCLKRKMYKFKMFNFNGLKNSNFLWDQIIKIIIFEMI